MGKGLEKPIHLFLGKADASVSHGKTQSYRLAVIMGHFRLDVDFTEFSKFDRVAYQVVENLAKPHGIPYDLDGYGGVNFQENFQPLLGYACRMKVCNTL